MPTLEINYLAVLVAGVLAMAIGAIWYQDAIFGRAWLSELGKKPSELGSGNIGYVIAMASNLLIAYVLAHFVDYTQATTIGAGVLTGFWLWLGFVATTMAMNYTFEGRSTRLFWINSSMQLAVLVVCGAILAVWQ